MPALQHRHRWRVEKRGVKRNAERAQSAASSAAAATGGACLVPAFHWRIGAGAGVGTAALRRAVFRRLCGRIDGRLGSGGSGGGR